MISDLKEGPAILASKSGWIIAGSITKVTNKRASFSSKDKQETFPILISFKSKTQKLFQNKPIEEVLKWIDE